jgi:hypothetical protein
LDTFNLLEKALLKTYPVKKIEMENYITKHCLDEISSPYAVSAFLNKLLQYDLPSNISQMKDNEKKMSIMYKFLLTMAIDDNFHQKMMEAKSYIQGNVFPRRVSVSALFPSEKSLSLDPNI